MNEKPEAREVRHEIYIEASPETVFALLTDATVITKWQAETVDANPMRGVSRWRRLHQLRKLRSDEFGQIGCRHASVIDAA
jgi:uncharacterized protein YndB with AHSA1/START domain